MIVDKKKKIQWNTENISAETLWINNKDEDNSLNILRDDKIEKYNYDYDKQFTNDWNFSIRLLIRCWCAIK